MEKLPNNSYKVKYTEYGNEEPRSVYLLDFSDLIK